MFSHVSTVIFVHVCDTVFLYIFSTYGYSGRYGAKYRETKCRMIFKIEYYISYVNTPLCMWCHARDQITEPEP